MNKYNDLKYICDNLPIPSYLFRHFTWICRAFFAKIIR